jgi:hypothetical protein
MYTSESVTCPNVKSVHITLPACACLVWPDYSNHATRRLVLNQSVRPCVTICHIRSPLMNLTGCEIRFVLFGPGGRVTEWSLTPWSRESRLERHARQELSVRSQLHKLCLKCEQIQFPPSEGSYRSNEVTYFKSMALLESSASSGCHLCTLMVHGLARSLTRSSSLYDQPYGVIRVCYGPEYSEPEVQIEYGGVKATLVLGDVPAQLSSVPNHASLFILRSLRTLTPGIIR